MEDKININKTNNLPIFFEDVIRIQNLDGSL